MTLLTKVADRIIAGGTDWAMDINQFDWVPGVGLYGICKAYQATGDKKYLNFLEEWAKLHLNEAYATLTVNSTAPLLSIIELYRITKKAEYLTVCTDIANYIITKAPITVDGGLEHTVTEAVPGFGEQLWADTLFMACIFLAKLGMLTDHTYSNFATEQLRIHHKMLCDPSTSLYYHGWNGEAHNHMSGVFWGRANAWVIYSSMTILNTVGFFDGRDEIEAYVRRHAAALTAVQRENGGFGTILNDPYSYDEISATAGIAAGLKLAVNAGLADASSEQAYRKALTLIKQHIREDGTVDGVSTGTPVMPSAQAYKDIALCPTLYGQGLAAVALQLE